MVFSQFLNIIYHSENKQMCLNWAIFLVLLYVVQYAKLPFIPLALACHTDCMAIACRASCAVLLYMITIYTDAYVTMETQYFESKYMNWKTIVGSHSQNIIFLEHKHEFAQIIKLLSSKTSKITHSIRFWCFLLLHEQTHIENKL